MPPYEILSLDSPLELLQEKCNLPYDLPHLQHPSPNQRCHNASKLHCSSKAERREFFVLWGWLCHRWNKLDEQTRRAYAQKLAKFMVCSKHAGYNRVEEIRDAILAERRTSSALKAEWEAEMGLQGKHITQASADLEEHDAADNRSSQDHRQGYEAATTPEYTTTQHTAPIADGQRQLTPVYPFQAPVSPAQPSNISTSEADFYGYQRTFRPAASATFAANRQTLTKRSTVEGQESQAQQDRLFDPSTSRIRFSTSGVQRVQHALTSPQIGQSTPSSITPYSSRDDAMPHPSLTDMRNRVANKQVRSRAGFPPPSSRMTRLQDLETTEHQSVDDSGYDTLGDDDVVGATTVDRTVETKSDRKKKPNGQHLRENKDESTDVGRSAGTTLRHLGGMMVAAILWVDQVASHLALLFVLWELLA